MRIFFITWLILLCFSEVYTNTGILKVLDWETREPLPYANIYIEGLETNSHYSEITSADGIIKNPVKEKSVVVISFVGYKTLIDTIQKNESKILLMESDLLKMDQVVVTGTRTRKALSQSPVLIKVVTSEELKEAGAVTALDALEFAMPGVQFSPDSHGDNLQIQGLDNDYILVLVDGERMVGETRGNVNFDRLRAENIKRIEIVNGASSVLYGSNAIGAVINIITNDEFQLKPFEAKMGTRYSKYNEWLLTSNVNYSSDKFSVGFNEFRSSTDGYDLTPETPASYTVDKHTDYSCKVKLGYCFNQALSLSTHGTYYQHELVNPVKSTKSTHDLNKNYSAGVKVRITPISVNHTFELRGNTDIYNSFTVYERKDDEKELDSDYHYSTILLTDTYCPGEKLEFVAGIECNFENIYSLELFGGEEDDSKNKKAADYNTFVQLDYSFLSDFELIVGLRNTYHTNYGNHITPKLSLMYSLASFKFRSNIAKGYKAPSLKELYYNFDHHGMFMIYGNPDLRPEDAFYTSLSTEYTRKAFNVSVNVYYNSINDKIESVDRINAEIDMLEKHYLNVDQALLRGVESYFTMYLFKDFVTKAGYAYSDTRDESTGLQLYGNSKHSATFSITYKRSKVKFPFSISLNGRASSGQLFQEKEIETDDETGEEIVTIIKDKSEAYTLWKLTYNQQFHITQKLKLQLQAGVNNIFNYTDTVDLVVVDPGRRVFAGMKIIF